MKITASLGVSPAAPYRHFASKEALLEALVEMGLAEFQARAEAVVAMPGDPLDRLRAGCAAYLDYAEQMPGLFHLLLGSVNEPPYDADPTGGVHRAYEIFGELVRQAAPALDAAAARAAAAAVWSQLQGHVVLSERGLFKRVAGEAPSREMVIETAVRLPAIVEAMRRNDGSAFNDG